MRKNKLLLLLALLLTAATGAWAQEPATTYSVKMKDGTVDAKNWTIASGEKSATGDAADGLTGLSENDAVTLTYNGRLKVKGVKATSDAAPAPSVPDGAISGVFSVSASKKVYFSKGNLRYASSKWSFFDNQYDYYDSHSDDAWDKFGWSTSATTHGMNTSAYSSDYSGDFVDWGATMGTGWFTLSSDEWTYLFNNRTVNGGTGNGKSYTRGQSVNGTLGVVIYPDNYTGAVYSGSDWATFESAGCVFLPAAGIRSVSSVYSQGTDGFYWSATPSDAYSAYCVEFGSGYLTPASYYGLSNGCSVRLVREVATSDAEAPAATPLDASTTAWTAGSYAVPAGGLTYSDAITVSGDVTLTLTDGETLTLNKGISLAEGATLTVEGEGTMTVNGTNGSTASTVAGTGTLILTSGTLNATGGNGADAVGTSSNITAKAGGVAINGAVTVSGGTLTATGGNGGSITGQFRMNCKGGAGGAAISGALTINGGTVTTTNGTNGSVGSGCFDCTAGAGGAAAAGGVTDNR